MTAIIDIYQIGCLETKCHKDVDPVSYECCAKTTDCVRKDCF